METGAMIILLIFGILVLVGLVFLVIYILNRMKVKIKLKLDKFEFIEGETIKGKILLKVKKPISPSAVRVGIVGYSTQSSISSKGYSSSTRQVYDFMKPVAANKSYTPGNYEIPFNLKIPSNISAGDFFKKGVGKVIGAVGMATGLLPKIKWYLYADLDLPGINPSTKVRIMINEKPNTTPVGAIS